MSGTTVYTATATDIENDAISYALTGTDASAFSIDSSTGVVTINATPDFETKSSYSFDVKASDPSGAFDTQTVTVSINALPPVILSGSTASVNEGVAAGSIVYTAVAADPAGGTVTYALTPTFGDATAFNINASTGVVTINTTPDYETKSAYSFKVEASDPSGVFSTKTVTVSVNDLPPVISSASTASVDENVAAGTTVYTTVAADPAGGTVTYALVNTGDFAAFSINSSTGVVTINATPDFETKSSYTFNVKASDASGAFSTQTVTVNINDLPPVISSGSMASVDEKAPAGTTVYTAVAADPAGGTVTYALSGTDASAFSVNSATGAVTINASPDYETKNAYSFDVQASD